jgi:ATP synthase F1 delta subunit
MTSLSLKRIVETIYDLTQGKTGAELQGSVTNIVRFLAKKRLLGKAPKILNMLADYTNKKEGVVVVKVTFNKVPTAEKIKELELVLKKRYQVRQVALDVKIDPNVFGGVRIEGVGEVIDLTLKNKLKLLQNHLITN